MCGMPAVPKPKHPERGVGVGEDIFNARAHISGRERRGERGAREPSEQRASERAREHCIIQRDAVHLRPRRHKVTHAHAETMSEPDARRGVQIMRKRRHHTTFHLSLVTCRCRTIGPRTTHAHMLTQGDREIITREEVRAVQCRATFPVPVQQSAPRRSSQPPTTQHTGFAHLFAGVVGGLWMWMWRSL